MKRYFFGLIGVFMMIIGPAAFAAEPPRLNAVEMEITVREKPARLDKYFEIARDTAKILVGERLTGLFVNAGLEIKVSEADSQSVDFTTSLITIGKIPYIKSDRFKVEFNLPARIDNVPGKNGAVYQFLLSPRKMTAVDTTACPFDPNSDNQFKFEPSANFDFYFIENSLADFQYNNIRGYIETDYVRFRDALDMTSPGKINYFLCPCACPTINWDKRFGYNIDPGRNAIYSIYSHNFVSTDAMLPNMLKLLRLWGYAPPFLVEGLAGYFEFVTYEMKKIKNAGKVPELGKLLTSAGYYAAEPHEAEVTAASFVKYLADSYGIGKVKELYERSDDLNLKINLMDIYSRSLDSLEAAWSYYVDTVPLIRPFFDLFGARAGAIYRTDQQIEYYEQMAKYDSTRIDSVDTWKKLASVYFVTGQYYKAEEANRRLLKIDSSRAVYYQVLGNLALIDGKYDHARTLFDSVILIDSTYATARLLQGRLLAIAGDTAGAAKLAQENFAREKSIPGKIEFLLFMGRMYSAAGKTHDSAAAEQDYTGALTISSDLISKVPDDPVFLLRAGLASLGLGEYDNARSLLEGALFRETRAYFRIEALLALGNLYDLKKDHEKAGEYYRQAMAGPIAVYQRDLCLKYIDSPYHR